MLSLGNSNLQNQGNSNKTGIPSKNLPSLCLQVKLHLTIKVTYSLSIQSIQDHNLVYSSQTSPSRRTQDQQVKIDAELRPINKFTFHYLRTNTRIKTLLSHYVLPSTRRTQNYQNIITLLIFSLVILFIYLLVDSNQQQNNIDPFDLKLGKSLFKQDRIQEALIIFENYLVSYGIHPEALYLSALCYQQQNQYDKLIQQLEKLISVFPTFQRDAYLILANTLAQMNRIQDSINNLTLAISNFNRFYDAVLLRAQLYLKSKFTHKAIQDFNQLILINPKKSIAYLGLSDCFAQLNQLQLAFNNLNKALQLDLVSNPKPIIIKLFWLFFDVSDYRQSNYYLDILKQMYSEDSESAYLKGLWFKKQNHTQEAYLAFEQAVQYNNNKLCTTYALLEIVKLEIDKNNYYSASHYLERKVILDVFNDQFTQIDLFVEGTLLLMKKQFDKGVESLSQMMLYTKQEDSLKVLALQFRAYGYFCLSNYRQALKDLLECDQNLLEKASVYNILLCRAILKFEAEELDSSYQLFSEAYEVFKTKQEPYFYQATLLIRKYCININEDNRIIYLNQALESLQKALSIRESPNVLFYKGILNFALGNLDQAEQDLEQAIENFNENQALHFYVRGLLRNCLKQYEMAILDFKSCLHMEPENLQSYLNKCRAEIHIGDLENAYLDLMKYVENCKEENLNYQVIGMLFFYIGSFEEAIFSLNMDSSIVGQYLKIKVLIFNKELSLAQSELQLISEKNQKAMADFQLVRILNLMCSGEIYTNLQDNISVLSGIQMNGQEGEIFKQSHIWFYYCVLLTYKGEYQLAQEFLNLSYELERKSENFNSNDFGNQIYTFKEYLFNSALLNLMMNKMTVAIELLNTLYDQLNYMEEKVELQIFIKQIKDDLQDTDKNKKLITYDEFYLFQQKNRLSSLFPVLQLPLKKYNVTTKLSFCLPRIEFPSLEFVFDEKVLQKISVSFLCQDQPYVVENYPEAPWIKRIKQAIVFTDNLRSIGEDLESTIREKEEIKEMNQVEFDDE
ncbi:unnamed protein product (macronuclear) [Paramecium tetraurelia]|uniref:Uncharacterized protein n=1 Tax=Paramecium tetraurelia TaxID=5888 RepID=A0C3C2_PARTE|nr:uncharacterized protein GSPATT00034768001 [Paramecium tetraurelia]CAK65289.1 unnamed protein product [Paramecium tetraurelia]|eukprot:XP_001432686.1 hypothetical protein (macronuclear) [Paramecium tetraurelia strain d4-2]